MACGILVPQPELNVGPLQWDSGVQPLDHQGSPGLHGLNQHDLQNTEFMTHIHSMSISNKDCVNL